MASSQQQPQPAEPRPAAVSGSATAQTGASQISDKIEKKRNHDKLARVPKGMKVSKRPLLRPVIPSPYASSSSPKVVYITVRTPFMSAVSRVRSLLREVDKRAAQRDNDNGRNARYGRGKQQMKGKTADKISAAARAGMGAGKSEEVTVKGSGRAIEKVLNVASWFGDREREEGVRVRLVTSSVTAIDDVDIDEETYEEDVQMGEGDEEVQVDEQTEGSRFRQISVLEARISLR